MIVSDPFAASDESDMGGFEMARPSTNPGTLVEEPNRNSKVAKARKKIIIENFAVKLALDVSIE